MNCLLIIVGLCAIFLNEGESKGVNVGTKLLVVSFDGFRWDYPELFNTTHFHEFKRNGVYSSEGVTPVFVSNTFPNHFSIATGLFAEDHGIVDNNMYNMSSKTSFRASTIEPNWWQGGEPIWVTAKRQGLRTGVFFWVGSEVKIRDHLPDKYEKYEKTVPYSERVETVVGWLKDDLVDLAMVYFEEPDSTGHEFGIESQKFKEVVENTVDSTLGSLVEKLNQSKVLSSLNLLVVSDHGMTNIKQKKLITLTDYISRKDTERVVPGTGPTIGIYPAKNVSEEDLYKRLQTIPNLTVFRKQDIPKVLRYQKHDLIAPLVAIADEGFVISSNFNTSSLIGYHGYLNNLTSMRSIFMARGPAFKTNNFTLGNFQTVDIYPLMCHLLNIQPAPNNGSLKATEDALNSAGVNSQTLFLIGWFWSWLCWLYAA